MEKIAIMTDTNSGMTPEEVAARMDVPLKAVKAYMR